MEILLALFAVLGLSVFVGLSDSNADAEVTTTQSGNTGQIFVDGRLIATVTGPFDGSDGIGADVVTTIYGD